MAKYTPFCVQTAMPFFVGDRVTCNAAMVLGNEHAKQRYGTLKNSSGVCMQRIEGKGRSIKCIVYLNEVATSKVFWHAVLGGKPLQQATMLKHPFLQPFLS